MKNNNNQKSIFEKNIQRGVENGILRISERGNKIFYLKNV